ncbi:MAG: asparagine synthase (glutamine-hydrolyzing) [Candidatus Omnitrophica bacterium]|nr:asparagine synthase (glutamine-hydrolyzing) [Candidatus Omnitrophota bacterium]MCM8790649.1 asparagine synthase (glutamine-hydrolyzing) [Candidatus Omnitrophota bacterium]
MCGIAGLLNLNKYPASEIVLRAMVDIQRHRGPDDTGMYVDGPVGLGHARLSIIDLSKDASQPMTSDSSGAVIVHNGEIYNYRELRDELIRLGFTFKSKSDTEVILHAYEKWGTNCLNRFNGMWSFVIYDPKKREIFCSRDRFGVKPFYYYSDRDIFIFASEIKALLAHPQVKAEPDDKTIYNYVASGYGYIDISERTFFKGIRQLKAGHYAKLSLENGKFTQVRYWSPDPAKRLRFRDEEEAFHRFYELFEDSVRLRLRSDVPLGVSLSGGLDSSSIACVAARLLEGSRLEAFSSCFDTEEECDERRFIRPVLDRTGAHANFIFAKPERLFDDIEDIIWHQDEPYSTLSIFPQWYVMKLAKEKGVKVLLTGQGGDETLAGYNKYYLYLFADLIYSGKWAQAKKEMTIYKETNGIRKIAAPVARIMLSYTMPERAKALVGAGAGKAIPDYLNKDFASASFNRISTEKRFKGILNNELYNAFKISPLPSLLHVDDRSSMAHSVESRAPFLDYRIVEFMFSIGPEYKIRDGVTKYILRRSLKDILPAEVRNRTDKMGFAAPLARWFKFDLKGKVFELLSSSEFARRPYFDQKQVLEKFDRFVKGYEPDAHFTIWSWVNLELWLRKFIDKKP